MKFFNCYKMSRITFWTGFLEKKSLPVFDEKLNFDNISLQFGLNLFWANYKLFEMSSSLYPIGPKEVSCLTSSTFCSHGILCTFCNNFRKSWVKHCRFLRLLYIICNVFMEEVMTSTLEHLVNINKLKK